MTQSLSYGNIGHNMGTYYRHSGKVTLPGAILAAIIGIPVGIIAALIYAYLDLYIPIVYINFIGTAGFGFIVGFVVAYVAKTFKLRSVPVLLAVTFVVTLIAYYFSWIFWVNAAVNRYGKDASAPVSELLASPAFLWDWVQAINESGTWSIGRGSKEAVSGWFLTIVWIIEGGAIFVVSMMVANSIVADEMFCEPCNRWCGSGRILRRVGVGDAAQAKAHFEAHDFAWLDTLPAPDALNYWELSYGLCGQCKQLHAITLTQTTITVDKKQKETKATKTLIDRLLVSPEEAAGLVQWANGPAVPPGAVLPPPLPAKQ